MGALRFFLNRPLDLAMLLYLGGICLLSGLGFAAVWAFSRRNPRPAVRTSLPVRVLLGMFAVCFFTAGAYFSCVKDLGDLVGGTTNSGRAGLASDGTYYLYSWWRPDKRMPVSPEKYRALYLCEHQIFWTVFLSPFLLLGLVMVVAWLKERRSSRDGTTEPG